MLVGEQPGDQRGSVDLVGPAGEVLDQALAEVGMDRTNRLRTSLNISSGLNGASGGDRRSRASPRFELAVQVAHWSPDSER